MGRSCSRWGPHVTVACCSGIQPCWSEKCCQMLTTPEKNLERKEKRGGGGSAREREKDYRWHNMKRKKKSFDTAKILSFSGWTCQVLNKRYISVSGVHIYSDVMSCCFINQCIIMRMKRVAVDGHLLANSSRCGTKTVTLKMTVECSQMLTAFDFQKKQIVLNLAEQKKRVMAKDNIWPCEA